MAVEKKDDQLVIGGKCFDSRFILGSGKYSLELIKAAVEHAGAQMIMEPKHLGFMSGDTEKRDYERMKSGVMDVQIF